MITYRANRWTEFLLPTAFLAGMLVLLVPLPVSVIDLLLAANITVSVLVLLSTIQVGSPSEFSTFPTVLLSATLFRLVLNIGTTRLILTRAPEHGIDAAGGVIRQFAQFVAADQLVVGAVIFAIVVVVQYLVITHGATRISEVAARFSLDGMPGRQMAIDADVGAGHITEKEARQLRDQLQRDSDFYGAMDGASRFVRGDAVAGFVIIAINLIGGLLIGTVQGGMSLAEAATVFTHLSIGDGLVSQVPALLTSVATALLITRASAPGNLSSDFVQQISGNRVVLVITGVFILSLTALQLPMAPLMILSAGCLWLAWRSPTETKQANTERKSSPTSPPPNRAQTADVAAQHVARDPLEIQLGSGLIALADPRQGGDLLQQISGVRQEVASDLGMLVPKVRVRDNARLTERSYLIQLGGSPIAEGTIFTDRLVAVGPAGHPPTLPGRRLDDSIFGGPAVWIDNDLAIDATSLGLELLTPSAALARHLRSIVRTHSDELINRDVTRALVEELRPHAPAIVEETFAAGIQLGQIQTVLKNLVDEDVPIRQLGTILEAMLDASLHDLPPMQWIEPVRRRLARTLCSRYRDPSGTLKYLRTTLSLDAYLQERMELRSDDFQLVLPNETTMRLRSLIVSTCESDPVFQRRPIVVVSPGLRRAFRHWSQDHLPELIVLSAAELVSDIPQAQLGVLELPSLHRGHEVPGPPTSSTNVSRPDTRVPRSVERTVRTA